MAIAGSELKYTVVGPSISRRTKHGFQRSHSWACDEPCELNILESEKVSAALAVLQRCSKVNVFAEREPAATILGSKPDESNTGAEENRSTKDGSGTDNEPSIEPSIEGDAAHEAQVFPSAEGDFTVWPDTDSEDGYNFSTWDIRRGSDGTESASTPVTAEVPDECMSLESAAIQDSSMTEPDGPRTAIKVRTGMVIDELTTLMIRNLPTSLQQDRLILELANAGFSGLYDFCHLPVWTASGTRKGYAFVNMISQAAAEQLSSAWHKTRQAGLGMKQDDQTLDIVAANIQGLEANLAMLNEPRKKRGGKATRPVKGRGLAVSKARVRSTSTKTSIPTDSPKAPSMPPGTFHEFPSPTRLTGKGTANSSDAAITKGGVLGLLGFPSPQGAAMMQGSVAVTPVAAMTSTSCDPCARLSIAPMVLSIPAQSAATSRSVPR